MPRSALASAVAMACAAAADSAAAQEIRIGFSSTAELTYTDNVNFSVGAQRQSAWVAELTGTMTVSAKTPKLSLNGSISATAIADSSGFRSGVDLAPNGGFSGTYEAIDNYAFIDYHASVGQTYSTPFGPQPENLANASANRYTQQAYGVSPYVRGKLPADISYVVRDDNNWTNSTNVGNSGFVPPDTYANAFSVRVTSSPSRFRWELQYDRDYYDSGVPGGTSTLDQARLIVPFRVDPTFEVSGRVGYERARFSGTSDESSIYGFGVHWTPTERTNLDGVWEHRFFGTGYSVNATHRLPRVALSASFNRGASNFAQLALAIPTGANVANFVNAAFTSRIPDPTERATAVQQFLARSGLPATLFTPVNFYSTSFLLQTSENLSATWLGLRNNIALSVFRVKSETLPGVDPILPPSFVPPELQFSSDNIQTGVGVGYSYRLSGLTNLGLGASWSNTHAITSAPDAPLNRAINENLNANIGTQLGAYTTGTVGVGYSRYRPEGASGVADVSAFNIYAAITHVFR